MCNNRNTYYTDVTIPVTHIKKRNPNGFEPISNKYDDKCAIPTTTVRTTGVLIEMSHPSTQVPNTSDASIKSMRTNMKTIPYTGTHQSKAHSKRARNRSLEMVLDDEKADSSPSRSR